MNRIPNEDIRTKVEFHLEHKIPYTLELSGTSGRRVFKSERGNYMTRDSKFTYKDMLFIKSVKEYIVKNKLYERIPNNFKKESDKDKIKYYHYNPKYKEGDFIDEAYEIDLKRAYFETLNKMGLLSPELYEKGRHENQVSKVGRLASIGSLAKRTRTIKFDGVKQTNSGLSDEQPTAFLWDTICYKVGKIMMDAAKESGSEFIFFWVDAIFVKENTKDKIVELFKSYGFNSSVYKCESIQFNEDHIIVCSKQKMEDAIKKMKDIKQKNGYIPKEERPFPFIYKNKNNK